MSFLYEDIVGEGTNSGQYRVYFRDIKLGSVFYIDGKWRAIRPGCNEVEANTFNTKDEASKYLAQISGINHYP